MFTRVEETKRRSWLAKITGDRLLRNFGLLGFGEIVVRMSRIVTTIILARYLGAVEFGIAAVAITCFELVRVLANNGLSQLVVKAPEVELRAVCNTAHRILVFVCVFMAALQLAAGAVIAWYTGRPELFSMIACLTGVYVVLPWSMVQYWLLQRAYRLGTVAGINTLQVSADNILTAILAVAGFGAWAIVLPKLLTAPIWLIGMRRAISWRRQPQHGGMPIGQAIRFCLPILASELLVAVRQNADNMLVGAILGLEALGIYYFAFNAGYGLSTVLTNALAAVGFRHLADPAKGQRGLIERFDHALIRLALPIGGLILAQAILAPLYVPIIFGAKWEPAVMIVAALCVSASTRASFDLSSQLLRAGGLQSREFAASLVFTAVLLAGFAVALPYGLLTGVVVLTVTTVVLQAIFVLWARHRTAVQISEEPAHDGDANAVPMPKVGAA